MSSDNFRRDYRLTRKKRYIKEELVYHVIQRAPGDEVLFVDDSDRLYFVRHLKYVVKEFDCDIFAFVLMTNHVHILLKIHEKNISEICEYLFRTYAIYFNKKYKRKGHVFQGPFISSVCDSNNYILACSIYIHLNPIKAGLCLRIGEYRWSSLGVYLNDIKKSFITTRYVYSCLENSENFIEIYKKALLCSSGRNFKLVLKGNEVKRAIIGIKETLINFCCKGLNFDEEIKKYPGIKGRCKKEYRGRRQYLIKQMVANGYYQEDIACKLNISKVAVSQIINAANLTKGGGSFS